jgi:hypothetical protein
MISCFEFFVTMIRKTLVGSYLRNFDDYHDHVLTVFYKTKTPFTGLLVLDEKSEYLIYSAKKVERFS